MNDVLKVISLAVVGLWPLIPLFWLPMRLWPGLKRTLGPFYFGLVGLIWLPLAILVWKGRELILSLSLPVPLVIQIFGLLSLTLGLLLQILTAVKLGRHIVGLHELTERSARLETSFPFNLCRHPTYLSHFMMFFGAASFTGNALVIVIAVLDLIITMLLIVPYEERELKRIFGKEYLDYMDKTPKIIPRLRKPD